MVEKKDQLMVDEKVDKMVEQTEMTTAERKVEE